jgi:hypothetical protein
MQHEPNDDFWFIFPYPDQHGVLAGLHPDDVPTFDAIAVSGRMAHAIGSDGDYRRVAHAKGVYRLRADAIHPNLIRSIRPQFDYGERVIDPTYPDKIGVIIGIVWHHQRGVYIYTIRLNGRKKSKWYFDAMLQPYMEKS